MYHIEPGGGAAPPPPPSLYIYIYFFDSIIFSSIVALVFYCVYHIGMSWLSISFSLPHERDRQQTAKFSKCQKQHDTAVSRQKSKWFVAINRFLTCPGIKKRILEIDLVYSISMKVSSHSTFIIVAVDILCSCSLFTYFYYRLVTLYISP